MYLIIGGDSTIGGALSAYWTSSGIIHQSSTRKLDVVNNVRPYIDLASNLWPELESYRFKAAVFCAGVTKLADCEQDPASTRKINVTSTIALANLLSKNGAVIFFLSSNQVFDGSQPKRLATDLVCPVNEYGRQKVDAERHILKISRSAVLRLTKVVHPNLPIVRQWQSSLLAGQPIQAFSDMYIAPIPLEYVVARIDAMVRSRKFGISHLATDNDISYYQFAQQIAIDLKCSAELVRPILSGRSDVQFTSLG